MRDTKHTPEPLKVLDIDSFTPVWIGCKNDVLLAKMHEGGHGAAVAPRSELLARAHRWVACVNACAGIPTEVLESGAVVVLKGKRDG